MSPYSPELSRRAVRMIGEVSPQYPTEWAAITAVAENLGIGTAEMLRTWVRKSEADVGERPAGNGDPKGGTGDGHNRSPPPAPEKPLCR